MTYTDLIQSSMGTLVGEISSDGVFDSLLRPAIIANPIPIKFSLVFAATALDTKAPCEQAWLHCLS